MSAKYCEPIETIQTTKYGSESESEDEAYSTQIKEMSTMVGIFENAELIMKTCYQLEGDGFLAPTVYDQVMV